MNYKECLVDIQATYCSQTNFSSPSKETMSKRWTDLSIPWPHVVKAKGRKMEQQQKRHPSKTGKKFGKEKDHCSHHDSAHHRGLYFRICLQQNARIINLKYIINK